MKRVFKKIHHFIERFHIFFIIEFLVSLAMVIVNTYDAFKDNLLFLIPASYFLVYFIFLNILEFQKTKIKNEFKILITGLLGTFVTLILVITSFLIKAYVIREVKPLWEISIIIYGSYAAIKFIITIIESIHAIKSKDKIKIATAHFAFLGSCYTVFMFTLFMFCYTKLIEIEWTNWFLLGLTIIVLVINALSLIEMIILSVKYLNRSKKQKVIETTDGENLIEKEENKENN